MQCFCKKTEKLRVEWPEYFKIIADISADVDVSPVIDALEARYPEYTAFGQVLIRTLRETFARREIPALVRR